MSTNSKRRPARVFALIVRALLGVVILAISLAIFSVLVATRREPPRVPEREHVRTVRVMEAAPVELAREWEGFGTARALDLADLSAEVSGVVIERPARILPGARIEEGELIIALAPSEYEQRLARAQGLVSSLSSELEGLAVEEESLKESVRLAAEATSLTQWELERLKAAEARGAAQAAEIKRLSRELTRIQREEEDLRQRFLLIPTRRQRLIAQINLEEAGAALADIDLRRTRITAPISGWIQSLDADRGERLAIGQPVARIVNLERIETPIRLPVSALGSVRLGDEVLLEADGAGTAEWRGSVSRISPEADAQTRTILVFAETKQRDDPTAGAMLLPGRFVTARVTTSDVHARIVAPRTAVSADRVMIIDDAGRAAPRPVRVAYFIDASFPALDPAETQWAVLESGVEPGERIIISNLDDLPAGAMVAAAEVNGNAAPAPAPGSAATRITRDGAAAPGDPIPGAGP